MSAEDAAEAASPSTASEATSSPAQESAAPSTSQPVTPAAEPASKSAKETVLDAVLKVIPADTETDPLATKPEDTQPEEGTTETETEDDDEAEPAPEASTPQIRKKIQKLLKKYHTQKKELYEATQELAALRPTSEIGHQMQTFAKANDLSAEDIANLCQIGAYVRAGDYKSFYAAVAPIVRRAQEYLGIALPKEARDAVQQGRMSEASAREYVRLQMDKQLTEVHLRAQQETAARQNLQSTQDYVQRTVSALEAQFAASDPDYKAKSESVTLAAKALLHDRGGTISNVQEALEITKAAYDMVNANIRRQRGPAVATPRQPNGNGQTRSARPEAKSPYEAALLGLERARNGAGF
jgi:hypothetical protein